MSKTGLFLTALVVLALGWEGYSLMYPDDDILPITTVVAYANAKTEGTLSFLLGYLMGHFFWPRKMINWVMRNVVRKND